MSGVSTRVTNSGFTDGPYLPLFVQFNYLGGQHFFYILILDYIFRLMLLSLRGDFPRFAFNASVGEQ